MDSERDEPIVSGQSARIYYAPVVSYLNGGVVDNIVIESTVKTNTNIYAKIAVSAACPNVYSYDAQTKNFTISSAKVAG